MSKKEQKLASTGKTNDIDKDTRNISCIRAEVNSVRIPIPAFPPWVVEVRNTVMTSSNEIIFRDLESKSAFFL